MKAKAATAVDRVRVQLIATEHYLQSPNRIKGAQK
jgi:hypothetical protein